jgi:hypothetical protein
MSLFTMLRIPLHREGQNRRLGSGNPESLSWLTVDEEALLPETEQAETHTGSRKVASMG